MPVAVGTLVLVILDKLDVIALEYAACEVATPSVVTEEEEAEVVGIGIAVGTVLVEVEAV